MMVKFLFVVAAALTGAWLAGANLGEPISPRAWQWALATVILACVASWMGRER